MNNLNLCWKIPQKPQRQYQRRSSGTIDFDELERKPRISIKYWEKLFKGKAEEVFDGIHGYIVFIRVSSVQKRHQSTTFEYLTKGPDYRWIEFDDKYIKIGF